MNYYKKYKAKIDPVLIHELRLYYTVDSWEGNSYVESLIDTTIRKEILINLHKDLFKTHRYNLRSHQDVMISIAEKYEELERKRSKEEFYLVLNHREWTQRMVAQFRSAVALKSADFPDSLFD